MTLVSLVSRLTALSRRAVSLAAFGSLMIGGTIHGHAATLPSGFTERQIASGLAGPTQMGIAPDGRIFICEEGGRLRVVKNGALLATPFLTATTNTNGERGLLGVAFDPAFATNRWVYVYYTSTAGTIHNRVSRFRASTTNPDVAESGSEQVLLDLPSVGSVVYHNGGAIHFGSDGKLYIGVGDNKTSSNSQSLGTVFGKMLRINPDGTIPTDNPFYGNTSGINRSIWAMGLRNPYNFGFDPKNGDMLINDVGENTWEEINDGIRGANYGWPTTEGKTTDSRFVSPIYVFDHNNGQCAIVGGCFYNPTTVQFPSTYVGRYFFGDYCVGWIRVLNPATGSASGFATGISGLVDTATANDGSLYYLARGTGTSTGVLFRVTYGGGAQAPTITQQPQSQTVGAGQSVTFTVAATGTQPFTYQWQRNGTNIAGATAQSYSFIAALADNGSTYRVIVTNGVGSATSASATLTVTGNAPVPTITTPTAGTTFAGGDTINYAGSATDAEDGTLPPSAFTWWVDLHHDSHTHPIVSPTTGGVSGSFTFSPITEVSSNIFIRIHLRVRDSSGAETETTRDIQPRKVQVTLATSPAGLTVNLDGQPFATPYTFTGVEGVIRSLGAPTQSSGGQQYTFVSWSDGGAATHDIATPASATTYTATFTGSPITTNLWEAESLPRTSSGAVTTIDSDTNTSGGSWVALAADGVGDYVDFTLPTIPAGTYQLKMRYKGHPSRGILSLKVDNTQIGGTLDQYSSTSTYPEQTFGNVTFTAAAGHIVRLTVTGRNAAATSYKLSADTFTLVPVTVSTIRAEAEALTVTSSGASTAPQTDANTSGGTWIALQADGVGDYMDFTLPNVPAGTYQLKMRYKGHPNRGILSLKVDGTQVGSTLDQYNSNSVYPEQTFGTVTFATTGNHTIRLTVTGRNAAAGAYTLSADAFTLAP